MGKTMKKLLFVITAILAFNALPIAFADDALPEFPAVDEPAIPPIDASHTEFKHQFISNTR